MRVAVLAGGVGAARFLRGLVEAVEPSDVTAIGNVGDDLEILGLSVSPDLDSVLYALAGRSDEERGWGRAEETWNALAAVSELGGEDWFRLGDRDLGLHLVRTEALGRGEPLSAVTRRFAAAFGLELTLLPATDDRLRTIVETPAGALSFQEWFVARGHRDEVDRLRFDGADRAEPAPGVVAALAEADLILIAPSNPFVSIGPILGLAGVREAFAAAPGPQVAVSPIVGGRALKGPADRMLASMGHEPTALGVARIYAGLVDRFVIDEVDAGLLPGIEALGMAVEVLPTVMRTEDDRRALAAALLPGG